MAAFREFVEALKTYDELQVIDEEVDCKLQASAICAMSQRVGGPAIQFNRVKGYPGIPLLGSLLSGPGFIEWPQQQRRMQGRISVALGLEPDTHYTEVVETVVDRSTAPIRAIQIESGPCQEVVIEGDAIDLYKYPVPLIHDKDGGRYLTFHVVLTEDPQKTWTNMGVYRLMIAGKNRLVQGGIPRRIKPTHLEQIASGYHEKGEAAPFAVVIGPPPEMIMAACLDLPPGTDEYATACGLGLTSIPLVKAKLSDILIPANAEIVLEGHIYPGETTEEGPFAGVSYYLDKAPNLVYRVECITQRKDPMLPFIAEGAKPSDTMCLFSVLHSVELLKLLRMGGIPAQWVTMPVEARLCLAIVSLQAQPVPGLPGRLAELVFGNSPFVRKVLVVDNDLDAEDLPQLITDKNFKASVERDYHISALGKPLGWTENHSFREKVGSTLFINATWRLDRERSTIPRRTTFEVCFPEEVRKRVIENWNKKWKLSPKVWQYKL